MKDAYSFDLDMPGRDARLQQMLLPICAPVARLG